MKKVFAVVIEPKEKICQLFFKITGHAYDYNYILVSLDKSEIIKEFNIDLNNLEGSGFTNVSSKNDQYFTYINFNLFEKYKLYDFVKVQTGIFCYNYMDTEGLEENADNFFVDFSKFPKNTKLKYLKQYYDLIREYNKLSDTEKDALELEILLKGKD